MTFGHLPFFCVFWGATPRPPSAGFAREIEGAWVARAFLDDVLACCFAAYTKAARALDAWMTSEKVDEDFTACDTALLNRFFRDYNATHSRGGTKPRQRSLPG